MPSANKKKANKKSSIIAHQDAIDIQLDGCSIPLGPYASHSLRTDPKHLCFTLSRYKFCAKMLEGQKKVLEIGCGDAIGLPIVAQAVEYLLAVDWDRNIIEDNKIRVSYVKNCSFSTFNVVENPYPKPLDAIYLLDVIEHLEPKHEKAMMKNITKSLGKFGICIVGTPNLEASKYASPQSQVGHINLKTHDNLRKLMGTYFKTVFLFSMNDEVVHTGFYPMAHYFFAIGIGPSN